VRQRLGEVVVREHGREPLADQLLALVAGDVFGRVVHRGETAVRIEGDDRVGSRFHQVSVAGFGTRQRLLGAFGLCDIAKGSDRTDDLAVHAEGPARDRHVTLFTRAVIDDPGLVATRLAAQDVVFHRRDVGSLTRYDVVGDRLADDVTHVPPQHLGAGLVRHEHPPISARDHDCVRQGSHDVGCCLQQVDQRTFGWRSACLGSSGRRDATSFTHA